MGSQGEKKWLSIEEAAERMRMTKQTLYNRISTGKPVPPHAKIRGSNRRLFKIDDVDHWIESQIQRVDPPKRKRGRPTIEEQMGG